MRKLEVHIGPLSSGIGKLISIFSSFDVNRDGKLSKRELSEAFYRLGVDFTPNDVYQIYDKYDRDGSGDIDYRVRFFLLPMTSMRGVITALKFFSLF